MRTFKYVFFQGHFEDLKNSTTYSWSLPSLPKAKNTPGSNSCVIKKIKTGWTQMLKPVILDT
jgi:hypothetical protein